MNSCFFMCEFALMTLIHISHINALEITKICLNASLICSLKEIWSLERFLPEIYKKDVVWPFITGGGGWMGMDGVLLDLCGPPQEPAQVHPIQVWEPTVL